MTQEQVKGAFIKNPTGCLAFAKRKDGNRVVELMNRAVGVLRTARRPRPDALAVLRVSSTPMKQRGAPDAEDADAETKKRPVAPVTNFDPMSCLAVAEETPGG